MKKIFFNDTATTEIYTICYTLSLHDALPIYELSDKLKRNYGLTLIAASRPTSTVNILGIKRPRQKVIEDLSTDTVQQGDVITIFGNRKKVIKFYKKVS